jgi:hypothetical protein
VNREGTLFCEECGRNLLNVEAATLPTKQIQLETGDFGARATWGTARFEQDAVIIMHVRDAAEPITLSPEKRLVIGRLDTSSSQKPDVDLSPFGAIEKGVSRLHAAIYRNDDTLTIIDMGSSNGTHLNGQRLIPQQPRVLRDGDEIRLGQLVAHIYFKSH